MKRARPPVPGSGQLTLLAETQKRDQALDALEATRKQLVDAAREIADKIHARNGKVTSPEVVAAMREAGWGPRLDVVDLRFMGAVFRKGWTRQGWMTGKASPGSHARPVAIWARE